MKNDPKIDAKLVMAYQAGDTMAITQLVKRWHLIFCSKAYWVVKDADLSKDIAQDSWQTIMKKLDQLQNPSRFKSWALRIVYTKSMDAMRMRQKHRNHIDHYQIQVEGEDKDTESVLDLKQKLIKEIKSLPVHQQTVLRLFYTEDYSLNDISELLDISLGTAKSRLFHAREKLKIIFKDKNYEN